MKGGIFVSGTGTDVGKTFVSALLVKALRDQGVDAGYFKPALSGAFRRYGRPVPADAEYVRNLAGLPEPPEAYVAYIYEPAVSPHLAGRMENRPIALEEILRRFRQVEARYDYIVAEGCGGIFCPLCTEGAPLLLTDAAEALGFDLLLVSPSGLGAINAAVLAAEHAAAKGLHVRGIVMNRYDETDFLHVDNKVQIGRFTGLPVYGLAENAKNFDTFPLL